MITLVHDESGEEVNGFKSYQVNGNFFLPPNTFRMSLWRKDVSSFREAFRPFTPVSIKLDSYHVMSGTILDQEIEPDDTVTITGSDHTWKLDGDLDPANKMPADTDLVSLVKRQVAPFGFTEILTDNNDLRRAQCGATAVQPDSQADSWTIKKERVSNERAWGFLNRLAAKYGYFVQPGVSGAHLSICKPEYNQRPLYRLQRVPGVLGNNVQQRRVRRGYRGVPTFVTGYSRSGNPAEKQVGNRVNASLQSMIESHPEIRDTMGSRCIYDRWDPKGSTPPPGLVQGGRHQIYTPRFITDQFTADGAELANRVNREFIDFFKNTLVYSATVPGHYLEGTPLTPDTMIEVEDPAAGIGETLYVADRSFSLSGDTPTTRLTLIRPQSYSL